MNNVTTENLWTALQSQIGQWSQRNFGHQNGLNEHAPMLGMCEELGEWQAATMMQNEEEQIDGVADFTVYWLDFCYRAELNVDDIMMLKMEAIWNAEDLVVFMGRTNHLALKRQQKIRIGTDETQYRQALQAVAIDAWSIANWILVVTNYGQPLQPSLFDLVSTVWRKVSQRDWIANKETGNSNVSVGTGERNE